MKQPVFTTSTQVMERTPVVAGTSAPAQTLFNHLVSGDTIGEFLEGFPTAAREQVVATREPAMGRMLEGRVKIPAGRRKFSAGSFDCKAVLHETPMLIEKLLRRCCVGLLFCGV